MNKENRISLFNRIDRIEFINMALSKVSTWTLIFSNLAIILFAIIDGLSLLEVLWIYWIQSVIIGIFNFIKILSLKDFSTEGFRQGNKQVEVTNAAKISTAIFFLFHYGFFHLIYAVFLGSGLPSLFGGAQSIQPNYLILSAIIFLANYTVEFIYYMRDREPKPNLGAMMFAPYPRIIPMHLTIIFAGFVGAGAGIFSIESGLAVIIFFTLLKTVVDVITHNTDMLKAAFKKKNK